MSQSAILVPQANPGAGYRALQSEIDAAVARVLQSGWYILGQEVSAFEAEFAAWLGATTAVGCGNGTDALALALRALGIGPGMSVVTVSHTAVATVAAIEMVGATPVLIDIEPDYYTMDPSELAEVLDRPPTGAPPIHAVIPVHLYGQPAALEPIIAACRGHGVAMVEDCAQAHGASISGRKVGRFGEIATFSFYPTKNLGGLGDGGMLATQDAKLGTHIAALRQYRLANALHQRRSRGEQPARRTPGGDPARETAPSGYADHAATGHRCRLRCGVVRDFAGSSRTASRRRSRLPPLRRAHAGACRSAIATARGRDWHRHSLPRPGAFAAGI